jgi:hypothetical protein
MKMTPKLEKKSNHGEFFYAVILADGQREFKASGLDGQRVYTIAYQDISAVVSDYPRVDSIKLLRKNLSPYHQVCRELGKAFTTLPARFGQIAQDEGEVRTVLQKNYQKIRAELGRFHNKVEMGLKLWWEVDNVFQYFLAQDQVLKSYREKLLYKSRPSSRMEQLDFGRYFHDRMNAARHRITEKVLYSLPPGEMRVEDPTEDKMVMNASLLVKKEGLKEFEGKVNKVASSLGREYSLKVEGPWVPFSFVERLELGLKP